MQSGLSMPMTALDAISHIAPRRRVDRNGGADRSGAPETPGHIRQPAPDKFWQNLIVFENGSQLPLQRFDVVDRHPNGRVGRPVSVMLGQVKHETSATKCM